MVTNGLDIYLDFTNTKSYPGSGTVITDMSGNQNNGTLINSPTFVSEFGGGVSLVAASSQRIDITNLLTYSGDFTIDLVFKSLQTAATTSPYLYVFQGSSSTTGWFFLEWNNRVNSTNTSNTSYYFASGWSSGFSLVQRPNHMTLVSQGGVFSIYNNGVLLSTGAASGSFSIKSIGIANGNHTTGTIYMFKTYSRALSQIEINQNFNAIRAKYNI
jgi:hypothetical protein